MDDYTGNASVMNKTQDLGKFVKRNLMLNKTMTQMMSKRGGARGNSGSKQSKQRQAGAYLENTQESVMTMENGNESNSVMLPIN